MSVTSRSARASRLGGGNPVEAAADDRHTVPASNGYCAVQPPSTLMQVPRI